MHTEGDSGRQTERGSPGRHRPQKPRALQKGGSIPFPRTQGREEPPGQASSPGQMMGGSDKGHTEFLGGASPTFPWMQDIPERLRLRLGWTPCWGLQSRPSSCCTRGRMMRGPWMPTSMPTTRPSRGTFGRWISGERAETWARTWWARRLTRRCAP